MMELTRRHWCVALFGAVLLHAAVAAAALWQAPESGAAGTGVGGIEVSLGPAGGAPGSTAAEVPAAAETAEAPQSETVTAVERLSEETEPEEAQDVEPEPVEEVAEPEVPDIREVEAVEAETTAVSEPADTAEAEKPLPPLPEARPRDVARKAMEEQPAPRQAEPLAEQAAKLPPSTPGTDGKAGTQDGQEAGSADAATGGGNPGQVADYMARLQAWLERHKEYPRHAKQRRQEGTVMLYFVMDREGRVLEHRLKQSSGYDLLDRAVQEMIERAQPLPEMPPEMTQARLELIVPVQFFLR